MAHCLPEAVDTSWAAFITALKAISGPALVLPEQVAVSYYQGYSSAVSPPGGRS